MQRLTMRLIMRALCPQASHTRQRTCPSHPHHHTTAPTTAVTLCHYPTTQHVQDTRLGYPSPPQPLVQGHRPPSLPSQGGKVHHHSLQGGVCLLCSWVHLTGSVCSGAWVPDAPPEGVGAPLRARGGDNGEERQFLEGKVALSKFALWGCMYSV